MKQVFARLPPTLHVSKKTSHIFITRLHASPRHQPPV